MYGGSWAFAMRDPSGNVCGIKLRNKDGTKSCVRGSRLGLIQTRTFDRQASAVLVTEGESDAFVASHWGFNAVGRPGAKACSTHLASLCKGKDVILMADRDPAGMDGARMLAADIRKRCKSCVIVTPPPSCKDLREWHAASGTAQSLNWLIRSSRGW
jgi:DNA primase